MVTSKILDKHGATIVLDVGRSLHEVRAQHRKSIAVQFCEIARLALGDGRLTPKEYFYYRLYDDNRFTFAEKAKFVGRMAQWTINRLANGEELDPLAEDKVTFAENFQSNGLPTAKIVGVYNRPATSSSVRCLNSRAELKAFLQTTSYPLFGKPVCGAQSQGSARLEGCVNGDVTVYPNRRVALDDLIDEIESWDDSYLFQEVVHPHPAIRQICGDKIASLRLVVLFDQSEPELRQAVWKIPVGNNIADNFWRDGNLLAPVDIATGLVGPAFRGAGLEREEFERHPDTDSAIAGFTVPHWEETKRICVEAARCFPDWKIQGWDVAVCEDGPSLQEVNAHGAFNILQLASGTGLLDDRLRALVTACDPSWRSRVMGTIFKRAWQVAVYLTRRKLQGLRRSTA